MELLIFILIALMTVIGLLIMMARLHLKRFLGYPNAVDIGATIVFTMLFHGTFAGMVVVGFASLMLSLSLWALRSSIGCERLAVRYGRMGRPIVYWKTIPASECAPHWLARIFSINNPLKGAHA
ncbi:hypothetical protein HOR97_gp49 [Agrobacterium phage Atu_ph03]|uniref:Uncharacterized protein n=2 Tax=Atuphduovirus TaxID=2731928 RepID=A0A2L0UYY1_9CAUD|nr:hypothetical protein HOR96_gp46 [Agrobacterium phage Atu_ph02]YP_009791890.1 hypothetical protein HOR97_gp49 [Agrobacterium phage Atu_ph03]AUZ94754.1 hypothetical protein [Agrobacterium phage Atu_ph02]AUZ94797.1 hypothetical protein [Agrobacterium phage Atu_ph03]